jgi:hypothetical protein
VVTAQTTLLSDQGLMMTTSEPRTLAATKQFITVFNKDKVMLRIIKQLYGKKLGTSEGDIGHVDCCFLIRIIDKRSFGR